MFASGGLKHMIQVRRAAPKPAYPPAIFSMPACVYCSFLSAGDLSRELRGCAVVIQPARRAENRAPTNSMIQVRALSDGFSTRCHDNTAMDSASPHDAMISAAVVMPGTVRIRV